MALGLSRTLKGVIIDLDSPTGNRWPLMLKDGAWVPFDGTLGEVTDSKPLSKEETADILNKIVKGR